MLFRQEAIDAQRHRLSGTVIAAVPPSARLYTIVIAAIAAVIVLTLTFGTYAASSAVRGVVAYDSGVSRVYPRSSGEVRRVFVREGQRVTAGAPLVEVALAQGERGLADQLEQLDRQIAEIDRQLKIATAFADGDTTALQEQRKAAIETAASLERQRDIARDQVALAEKAVARTQRLAKEGAGTQRQVDAARAESLGRRAEAENLQERLIATRGTIADLGIKLSQGGLASNKAASQLQAQRAVLVTQRSELERADRMVLVAPIAGEVGDVSAEPGRHAAPDASLVTVVPDGGALETWFYAPSQSIGFARVGDTVRLRFDAFPYQKYGSGRGTVTEISRVAVDPATIDPALGIREAAFRVRVRIDAIGTASATEAGVRPGMTVSGDLMQRRRPLWALLFSSIRESLIR
jgi:membrane fusion protein